MFRWLRRKFVKLVVLAGIGAVIAYLFDPNRGRARRNQLRDQAGAIARRRQAEAERQARYAAGVAQGEAVRAQGGGVPRPEDDVDVANVVKQVLARLDVPTSDVTVEAAEGIVTLRGQVPDQDSIARVTEEVRTAQGVIEVRSYLHLPGTPAPNKAEALRAS
jgi:osmotically-inducible protein OsmY